MFFKLPDNDVAGDTAVAKWSTSDINDDKSKKRIDIQMLKENKSTG
jgi:hypothetical protein